MNFAFRIGKSLVDYHVIFDYDVGLFEFDVCSQAGFLQNVTLIEQRLAAVDRAHFYRLLAASPVEWNGSPPFYLDCGVQFDDTVHVNWSLRLQSELSPETHATIGVWTHALHPVVVGTMQAHREQVHAEAKQAIRDLARQQATNMWKTADLVLRLLDALEAATGS